MTEATRSFEPQVCLTVSPLTLVCGSKEAKHNASVGLKQLAVMQVHTSGVSRDRKLSVYQNIHAPTFSCGQELCTVTASMRLQPK